MDRKIIIWIVSVVLLLGLALGVAAAVQLGDVNGDGILNREDPALIVDHYNELVELTAEELEIADVNRDDVVDIRDANILYGWINLGRNEG